MTYAEREAIFSKDFLTIDDIQKLLGMSYTDASTQMGIIRMKSDRLGVRGKIHVQDYLDFYNLSAPERYSKVQKYDD